MRYPRFVLRALLLGCSLGLAAVAFALPQQIAVTEATQFEIMRGGQVSGKFSLTVGAILDVENVDGEFVLARFRGVRGRVLMKATDFVVRDGGMTPPGTIGATPVPAAPPANSPPQKMAPGTPATAGRTLDTKPTATSAARVVPVETGPSRAVLAALLVAVVVVIASHWRLFTKAGKPGWAIFVPIYNLIVYQRISGKPVWWLLLYAVPVANLVVAILTAFGIASNFGRGKAFGLGVLLMPYFFVPILAFGKDQYVGAPI